MRITLKGILKKWDARVCIRFIWTVNVALTAPKGYTSNSSLKVHVINLYMLDLPVVLYGWET